jgi:hypothetical protein
MTEVKAQAEQRGEARSAHQAISAFPCVSSVFRISEVAYEP